MEETGHPRQYDGSAILPRSCLISAGTITATALWGEDPHVSGNHSPPRNLQPIPLSPQYQHVRQSVPPTPVREAAHVCPGKDMILSLKRHCTWDGGRITNSHGHRPRESATVGGRGGRYVPGCRRPRGRPSSVPVVSETQVEVLEGHAELRAVSETR